MSKFFSRMGTSAHKFEVDLLLHRIDMNIKTSGILSVTFKRGYSPFNNNLR